MEKFKVGDKFIPRKPKENYTHLFWDHTMDQYDGQTLIVQFATDDEMTAKAVPFLFHPDWCEKVGNSETPTDHIPDVGKMIDWEQREWELATKLYLASFSGQMQSGIVFDGEREAKNAIILSKEMINQLKQK